MPVVANGEIWNLRDWEACKEESGCEDFMLGRGLVACPDLALKIRAHAEGETYTPMEWHQIVPLLEAFYLATKDIYPARFLGNRVKQWLFYLQMHYPEAEAFFQQIKRYKQQEQFAEAFGSVRALHTPQAQARRRETLPRLDSEHLQQIDKRHGIPV